MSKLLSTRERESRGIYVDKLPQWHSFAMKMLLHRLQVRPRYNIFPSQLSTPSMDSVPRRYLGANYRGCGQKRAHARMHIGPHNGCPSVMQPTSNPLKSSLPRSSAEAPLLNSFLPHYTSTQATSSNFHRIKAHLGLGLAEPLPFQPRLYIQHPLL